MDDIRHYFGITNIVIVIRIYMFAIGNGRFTVFGAKKKATTKKFEMFTSIKIPFHHPFDVILKI